MDKVNKITDTNGLTFESKCSRNYKIAGKLRKYSRKLKTLLACRGITKFTNNEIAKSILVEESSTNSNIMCAKTTANLNDEIMSICSTLDELARIVDLYGVYSTSKYDMNYYKLKALINDKGYCIPIEIPLREDVSYGAKLSKEYTYRKLDILSKSDRNIINKFIEMGLLHEDYEKHIVQVEECECDEYIDFIMRYEKGDSACLNPLESPKEML